jgi:zeaxanthin glucosyltransferase
LARIGAFCFPGTGHLNPMTALARRLQQRGHSVVLFGIADVEERVRDAGIEFCLIGKGGYPRGTLQKLDTHLSQLHGLPSFRFTIERILDSAAMVLRDGPDAARRANVEAFLIDEADFGGNVADYLGLPWVSIAIIPPMVWDNRFPPYLFPWTAGQNLRWPWLRQLRNEAAIRFLAQVASPIFKLVNQHRKAWGLKPHRQWEDALSPLAQIAQLPAALEFDLPMSDRYPRLHYTGPFVDAQQRPAIDFEWDRLDSGLDRRPLVYASLGTLQNGSEDIFRTIAAACASLPVQLVMSLGAGIDRERLGVLPGDPIVVKYAPQLDLIKRATAVITHAGINTALESLAEGVPLVCIPIGNDQPGVAARVAARGAGVVVPRQKLNVKRLHAAVRKVLENDSYLNAAQKLGQSILQTNGLELAADIVEDALKIRCSHIATP